MLADLFYLGSCYNCVSSREYTVNCFVILAGILGVRTHTTLSSRFENSDITPNVIMHASQLYTIEQFLQSGTCGAVMYSSLVKTMHGMKGIPITPLIQQEVGIVWKKGKYINGSVEKFLDFMKKR